MQYRQQTDAFSLTVLPGFMTQESHFTLSNSCALYQDKHDMREIKLGMHYWFFTNDMLIFSTSFWPIANAETYMQIFVFHPIAENMYLM